MLYRFYILVSPLQPFFWVDNLTTSSPAMCCLRQKDMTSPFESEVHDHRTDEQRKRSKLVGQRDLESTGDTWQTQACYLL